MIKFLKLWLPVVIWALVIFHFSASPTAPIEPTSLQNIIIRKLAHMTEYGLLFFLISRALQHPKNIPLAFALSLFYAFTDETHQLFTPDRSARISDVFLFDLVGMIPVWYLLYKKPTLLKLYV